MTGRPDGAVTMNRERIPEGRRKIWAAIRMIKQFDFDDLLATTGTSYPNVRRYIRRLLGAGYLRLEHEARGAADANRYRLVRDTGPKPPIPRKTERVVFDPNTKETYAEQFGPDAQDLAWQLIRQGQVFELADLVEEGMQKAHAYKYLASLLEAGYIAQTRATKPGPGGWPAQYQCIRNTGPETPTVKRSGVVSDPNLD